jgi:hypothetical protein
MPCLAVLGLFAGGAGVAQADTVSVPTGSVLQISSTLTNGGAALVGDPSLSTGGIAVNDVTAGGTFTYNQTFGPLGSFSVTTGASSANYAFYTDYVFSVGPGSLDTISSTINLGTAYAVNGFQARLYSYNAGGNQNLTVPGLTSAGLSAYNSMALNGGVLDAWSSVLNLGGTTATSLVIPETTLAAGTYVLELRGTSVGAAGGSFSGVLNVTPVPLPAALPLLMSGLGLLGLRRRRAN